MCKILQRQKMYKSVQGNIAYNRENWKQLTCLSAKDQLSSGVENSFKILEWKGFPVYDMIYRHHKERYYRIDNKIYSFYRPHKQVDT